MKSQSKLLSVIGAFVLTATCSGQRPTCEKPLAHFANDIIKVDSILSAPTNDNRQRTSNIRQNNAKFNKNGIWFELNGDKRSRKRESVCPIIPEMDRPKKI
jgi:hypothetical protein